MVTCLFPKCVYVFVCVRVAEGPDSLLGPLSPSEGQRWFFFYFEQQVGEDAKSKDTGVLQSERDDKREKEGVSY